MRARHHIAEHAGCPVDDAMRLPASGLRLVAAGDVPSLIERVEPLG
jgi:hypothetical protein